MTPGDTAAHRFRQAIGGGAVLQIMAAHSPLSARLAHEAGFDAIWASGFELSALYALPDISLLSMTQHLDMCRAMAAATPLPVVADIDTGYGNALNVMHVVRQYEAAGAAAVVIEDKTFPKVTSLVEGGRQELVRVEEFQGKIAAAREARTHPDFVIVARTEALIAGLGQAEAARRAQAYEAAGADMILVHSKHDTPAEIEDFALAWRGGCPLVVVPTAYPQFTLADAARLKTVRAVIYGNHAIRASVAAMQAAFAAIRQAGTSLPVEAQIAPVSEIFRLQDMDGVKAAEQRHLK